MRRSLIAIVCVLVSACNHGPRIEVIQPIVVGDAGRVVETIDPDVSVEVANNTRFLAQILVGRTVVYDSVESQGVRQVGFYCQQLPVHLRALGRIMVGGRRTEIVYFRPLNTRYQTLAKRVTISCGRKQKDEFNVRTLQAISTR